MLHAVLREARFLVESGAATEAEIDFVWRNSLGRRLPDTGPLLSLDMGGHRTFRNISLQVGSDLCNDNANPYVTRMFRPANRNITPEMPAGSLAAG
jgi:3-hydroxybutyryl-CoA dehydrogenase